MHNRRASPIPSLRLCLAATLLVLTLPCAPQATPPTENQSTSACPIVRSPPTPGEQALSKSDYDAAEKFYQAALQADPTSEEAQLGHVRALIGLNNVATARTEAADALRSHPHSAIAEVAVSEAAYRAADFPASTQHAIQAVRDNGCEGRAAAAYARLSVLAAYFAQESRLLAQAHTLRPNDELIRRDWILSLPPAQRAIELTKYLGGPASLSTEDRNSFTNLQDHLNARQPNECLITSKTESTRIPIEPLFPGRGLQISLNGKRRNLIIDTGSSGITLTPDAAKRLGLKPEYHLRAGGLGDSGDVDSYLTHVALIEIGDVQITNCMVEVLQKAELSQDGLIGLNLFSHWLITLDYHQSELLLSPLPSRPVPTGSATPSSDPVSNENIPQNAYVAPEMADWLHLLRVGHELLVPARLDGGSTHYMMLDTGSDRTLLSVAFAEQASPIELEYGSHFIGLSGKVNKAYRTKKVLTLQFGSVEVDKNWYSALDFTALSHDSGLEISGLVGRPTIAHLVISLDYRDNLVQMKLPPKK